MQFRVPCGFPLTFSSGLAAAAAHQTVPGGASLVSSEWCGHHSSEARVCNMLLLKLTSGVL